MELLSQVAGALEKGETVSLASILEVEGSAPAPEGARLALFADGARVGTVGGGAPEAAVLEALARGEQTTLEFALDPGAQEPGLLCGGRIRVLVERVGPGLEPVFARAAAALAAG